MAMKYEIYGRLFFLAATKRGYVLGPAEGHDAAAKADAAANALDELMDAAKGDISLETWRSSDGIPVCAPTLSVEVPAGWRAVHVKLPEQPSQMARDLVVLQEKESLFFFQAS